jgi:transcriptional regulator with XRE-family HTH domain
MTQAQLAERLGCLQKTISSIEIGTRRVGAIELIQLGEALNLDPAAAIRRIAKALEE